MQPFFCFALLSRSAPGAELSDATVYSASPVPVGEVASDGGGGGGGGAQRVATRPLKSIGIGKMMVVLFSSEI